MITVTEARHPVLSSCRPLEPRPVPAAAALGEVLADRVTAPLALPAFANSAMDGYALRACDTQNAPVRLRVIGRVLAGELHREAVSEGEAVRIMTGAPLPPGADAVCMIERTSVVDDGTIAVIDKALAAGTNVRMAGEDIAAGSEVFESGTRLGPAHLGVLSSLGIDSVLCFPRPTVGVLSTGDELSEGPGPLAAGKIRDANRPALLAQLGRDGFGTVDLGVVGDHRDLLAAALDSGASSCDAVVASGGVSVGDRDVVKAVLDELDVGSHWMQVAVKPAKPFAFGVFGPRQVPVFGLPGNPVSALVSYELFVRPALRQMAGHLVLDRPRLAAVADADFLRRPDGKQHLVRAALRSAPDGTLRARPSGGQDSHMLRAMAMANGLAVLPDGEGTLRGGNLEVMLLDGDELLGSAAAPW